MGPDPEAKLESTASGRAGTPAGAPACASPDWCDRPWLVISSLCLFVFLTRMPFRTPMLTSWDAAQFALAMEQFDVARHRPHPPGYLPFVAAARAANLVARDANGSLVLVAIAFSMLGVAAVYGLGQAMYSGRVGVAAALLYATSPLHWSLGEVALPYTAEGALCALVAWSVWRSRQGSRCHAVAAGLTLGLAAGFRTNLLPFLLPALVYGLWRQPGRVALASLAGLVVGCAVWLWPTVALTGGLERYTEASVALAGRLVVADSVPALLRSAGAPGALAQLERNANLVCVSLIGGGLSLAAVLLLPLGARGTEGDTGGRRDRALFCAAVLVPAAAFYLFGHMARKGYVMTLMPVLLVLAAANAPRLSARFHMRGRWVVAAVAVANACLYAALYPPQDRQDVEALRAKLTAIRANFEPEDTAIVDFPDFRLVGYYLPEYQIYALPGFATERSKGPGGRVGDWGMYGGQEQFAEMVPSRPVPVGPLTFAPNVRRVVFADDRYMLVRRVPMRIVRVRPWTLAGVVELSGAGPVFHYDADGGWFGGGGPLN